MYRAEHVNFKNCTWSPIENKKEKSLKVRENNVKFKRVYLFWSKQIWLSLENLEDLFDWKTWLNGLSVESKGF